MGLFDEINEFVNDPFGYVGDVVSDVWNVVTGAVGEVISWFVDIEQPDIERNALINKQSNNAPIPIIYGQRRIGGTRVFVAVGGSNNEYLYIAQVLCEGEISGVQDTLINDIPISDSRFAGLIINVHGGTDDQAADSMLVNANVGWTANHRLRGIAYLAIRLNYNPDVFNSIPTITCVVNGKKIYNVITETFEYSDNPALCLGDYLYNPRYGKGLPISLLDIPSFTAAAAKCDELVAKYTGAPSNEPIFRCNAILDPSQTLFDNVQRLLSGMRGLLPFSNGQYKLIVEDDTNPVFAFDTSNIISRIRISSNTKNQKYNRVSVDFTNPDANWQTDTAIWPPSGSTEETTFLAEDNGIELTTSVNLSTITDYYAARDIARIICLESRKAKLAVSFRSTTDAMQCEVGDVVTVSHPTPAWTDKEFRVTSMVFNADGTISLGMKEHDATIYPWITDAQADPVSQSTLPDPFTVAAPTNLQAQARVIIQPDGTSIPVFDVSWTASADAFVGEYEIQYQTGADDYASVVTRETNFQIQNVAPSSSYIIRVRAVNSMGARSDFTTIANQTAVKDDQAPATPTGLTASGGIQSVQLDWTGNSEPDLRGYFVYENTSNNPSTAATLGFVSADVFTRTNLPNTVTRYYWVTAVDFSGNESSKSSVASATTVAGPQDGEDGATGSTGPRNATGYVFYQIQQSTGPSQPSASFYNFSDGTFSGLTSNWDESVSTQTPEEGKNYWASRYSVAESTFGGSQSISFTSSFVWQNFDGLVTFTNIQDGINNNVTTIDGGNVDLVNLNASNITTGTIDASSINVVNISADNVSGGTIDVGSGGLIISSNVGSATFGGTNYNGTIGRFTRTTDTFLPPVYLFDNSTDTFTEMLWIYAAGKALRVDGHTHAATSGNVVDISGDTTGGQGVLDVTNEGTATDRIAMVVSTGNKGTSYPYAQICTGGPLNLGSRAFWSVRGGYYDGGGEGYLPFTGVHEGLIQKEVTVDLGDILVDEGIAFKRGVSDSVCFNVISSKASQKSCIGIFAGRHEIDENKPLAVATVDSEFTVEEKDEEGNIVEVTKTQQVSSPELMAFAETHDICSINSVGEGQINVCGQAGDIEAGDLIVTSDTAGKGMKQSDDIVRSITVAKARESATFNNASEIKQIACIYLCG